MKKLTVMDLFCGAGGFSAGFKNAGCNIIFGIDNNKSACNTFRYNFQDADVVCENIREFDDFPKAGIIIGSPPCVEFSKGNVDRTFDTSLIECMIEIVDRVQPNYWVLENVPDTYDYVDAPVKEILNADDYGCATIRSRLFAGKYPAELLHKTKGRSVMEVININRCGFRQPYKPNVYRKINPDKPFVTLCSQRIANERYLLPNGTSLDVCEMGIIQGFPSWFVFPCSRSEMQRQIGNSVCPPVAEAIARSILEDINK